MAKVTTIPFFLLSMRSYYKVAEGSARLQRATTMAWAASTESGGSTSTVNNVAYHDGEEQKQVFWMRDPKTGNWIPESHFGEVDVAELREKLLPHANNKQKL